MSRLLGITLGILTAIGGFLDIGELVTGSLTGARFGMSLAWVVVVGVIGIMLYAEMSARIAALTGRAVFDIVRERLGPRVGLLNLGASFFVNFLTLAAEIGGVALALELASDVSYFLWIPLVGFAIWIVLWRIPYKAMERFYGLLGLSLVVFVVALFKLHPQWGQLWHGAAHPTVPHGEGHPTWWYYAIALFGAAMTPYEVFFFSSGAIEEKWTRKDLIEARMNVLIGFPIGAILTISLMAISHLVLQPANIQVDRLGQVALPVSVATGKIGLAFVLVGFFAATFGAAMEVTLSSGYVVAQYFGWTWGKLVRPIKASRFHTVALVTLVAAIGLILTTIDPVKVTEYSVVLSAVALPLTYFPILVAANDRDYLGDDVNPRWMNGLAVIYLVIIAVASLAAIPLMIATKAGPVVDDTLDIARTLLDRLLVDLKGEPLGRIDDVELEADGEGPPRVTALLCGPLALGPRLGHKWGDVWAAIGRRLRGRGNDEPIRVPWALVTKIGAGEVRLGITAAEAPTLELEHWTREHVIALIPGNGEG